MDLLGGYNSKSEDENDGDTEVKKGTASSSKPAPNLPAKAKPADRRFLKATPTVSIMTRRKHGSELIVVRNENSTDGSTALVLEPIQGPQAMDPAHAARQPAGKTEKGIQFDHSKFAKQRTTFQNTGRAIGPDETKDGTGAIVMRSTLGYNRDRLQLFREKEERRSKRPRVINDKNETLVYGSDDEAEHGIWAPPTKEERWHAENRMSDLAKAGGNLDDLAPEQRAEREYLAERDRQRGMAEEAKEDESAFDRLVERKMSHLLPPKLDKDAQPADVTTTFHGKDEYDYKGKSWMAPPPGLASIISGEALEMDHHKCFVPQKCAHRFSGHGKGVHRIRLFPKTGHLLLSAGLDGKCKVWSVATRQLMRTYEGHSAAVRDVQFNHNGSRFVSASFDRYLRMWDTESGKVVQTFGNRKVPYIIQFYPHDDNLFVVGCSDNKIVTYDATTGEVTQEYNHHLAPVNAIVFVEDHGTKMVSTSDDRKVLVWEWDIGVPIKYISDPTMHSMPCLTMHPSLQYFCAQSLDNHIAVFQAGNRFTLQKKKKFTGHLVAGYACDMAISPDGQYLASGDGNGKLWFWEWKRHKIMQKFKAHDKGPTIACVWHPLEPSVVFTCGWDGVIKMWQ